MKHTTLSALTLGITLVIVATLGYVGYRGYTTLRQENTVLFGQISTQNASLENAEVKFEELVNSHADLKDTLAIQSRRNELLEQYVNQITNTVANFEKLSKLDPELLKKYSKVYFLNENYSPIDLKEIPKEYTHNDGRTIEIHEKVAPFLENLFANAEADGLSLRALSSYRSFKTQTSLKAQNTVVYGIGANRFSADQGYSEHQLGTTVDFTTTSSNGVLGKFEGTKEYEWMTENAYKYGFILSYPKNNSYYIFEPWHWRFVGVALATKLHRDKMNFYDMDQREIDEYLLTIFD
ncbi:MAG: zinc D-Ala-D-Ala carboxypeptidase [Patescibacteria group bacterium]|jgi:D-alanyl-D-alanine carboxypeptidase|nr:zinc D-Ala-D-Ala carboxypeptidase [Patescibacteria group bacterium]MDQ5962120.1 zinc D-Ala-D-Ala carboxypeptidase [Patescibacteria group bacterium]